MNLLLPTTLAFGIVSARSLASSSHRMPYPYELASVAVIYTGAGLLGHFAPELGTAVAWGYLVALILTPSAADLLRLARGGVAAHGAPPTNVAPGGAA